MVRNALVSDTHGQLNAHQCRGELVRTLHEVTRPHLQLERAERRCALERVDFRLPQADLCLEQQPWESFALKHLFLELEALLEQNKLR